MTWLQGGGISPSLKAGENLALGPQHSEEGKSGGLPRTQAAARGTSQLLLLPSPPAARWQLRVAMETGCPPTGGCQLRFPAELRSRRRRGHPGVEMGLPGDIQPPANHTPVWESRGRLETEGWGSPQTPALLQEETDPWDIQRTRGLSCPPKHRGTGSVSASATQGMNPHLSLWLSALQGQTQWHPHQPWTPRNTELPSSICS